jgi:hypothetical protein
MTRFFIDCILSGCNVLANLTLKGVDAIRLCRRILKVLFRKFLLKDYSNWYVKGVRLIKIGGFYYAISMADMHYFYYFNIF